MEPLLSFALQHPYVVLSVFLGCVLCVLIGSIVKSITKVIINRDRCKRVDAAIANGYEYVELDDMVLQKHDENVKERVSLPTQEKNDAKIISIIDCVRHFKGGAS